MANDLQHKEQSHSAATFGSELAVFLRTAGGGQSAHTSSTYGRGLAYFRTYLEKTQGWQDERPVAELTPDMISEFPAWLAKQTYQPSQRSGLRPLSESSRSLYLLATSRFLRFMLLHKRLPAFDYTEYERIKEELLRATHVKKRPIEQKIPSEAIVAAMLEAARTPPAIPVDTKPDQRHRLILVWKRNLAIFLALKSSGMRVGELVNLTRSALDYERPGAWVTGKGRKVRFVAFDKEGWSAIQDYLAERHDESLLGEVTKYPLFCRHDLGVKSEKRQAITTRTVQRIIEELAQQAQVAERFNLSPHSLRHFFAARLLKFTGRLALVQDALGHESPTTTRMYTGASLADDIVQSVQAMEENTSEEKAKKKNG